VNRGSSGVIVTLRSCVTGDPVNAHRCVRKRRPQPALLKLGFSGQAVWTPFYGNVGADTHCGVWLNLAHAYQRATFFVHQQEVGTAAPGSIVQYFSELEARNINKATVHVDNATVPSAILEVVVAIWDVLRGARATFWPGRVSVSHPTQLTDMLATNALLTADHTHNVSMYARHMSLQVFVGVPQCTCRHLRRGP
jgi:hypothetical protein